MALRKLLFRPAQPERPAALPIALLGAYVLTAALAYSWTKGAGGLAVLWMGNGIVAASLLLLPWRVGVPLAFMCAVADFLFALMAGSGPSQSLLIASCDLAEAFLAATLIRRVGGAALDVTSLRRLGAIAAFAALPSATLIGSIGAGLSHFVLGGGDFAGLWTAWTIGDFLGMMIGAPATLLLARFHRFNIDALAGQFERIGLIALIGAVTAAVFWQDVWPATFLVFPVGLLVILRVNPPYTALVVLTVACVAAAATVTGHGPFAVDSPEGMEHQILRLQVFLASILLSAFTLSGLLAQRSHAKARLVRALAAARQSRRQAEQAAGAKSRFLAVMSHEMRTPLNGISGYAQLLDGRSDLPPQVREQIRAMHASADVLLALIGDVLDYSRGDAGVIRIATAPFSIAAVVTRTAEMVRPALNGRPVELKVAVDIEPAARLLGDERRMSQVLLNLLGNAVKFTGRGRIAVNATARPGADDGVRIVRIAVRDTGIGIPADMLDMIFEPFTQADATSTRTYEGAGLGLSISKSLVEAMGGQIGASSQEGVGSEFWFEIPLPCAATEVMTASHAPTISRPTGHVLVVDDHPVNREVASLMLRAAGFAVEAVDDGAAAVEAVRNGAFDLVFMDIHMPGMDGLQACQAIRNLSGAAGDTPVIAMTAAALPEDVERCLGAGMTDHLAKPINQEELLDKAFSHMEAARAA